MSPAKRRQDAAPVLSPTTKFMLKQKKQEEMAAEKKIIREAAMKVINERNKASKCGPIRGGYGTVKKIMDRYQNLFPYCTKSRINKMCKKIEDEKVPRFLLNKSSIQNEPPSTPANKYNTSVDDETPPITTLQCNASTSPPTTTLQCNAASETPPIGTLQCNVVTEIRKKGGRKRGIKNGHKDSIKLLRKEALTAAATQCIKERNALGDAAQELPRGRLSEICKEAAHSRGLPDDAVPYHTVYHRVKTNNPKGINKGNVSPILPVEPHIVQICRKLAMIGKPRSKRDVLHFL